MFLSPSLHIFGGRAQLDRVELWITPETRYRPLTIHEIAGDSLPYIHPFQLHTRNSRPPDIEKVEAGSTYMTFQLNRPGPLQSSDFRRWLCHVANHSLEKNARWFSEQCAKHGIIINGEIRDYEEFIRPEIIDAADLVLGFMSI